MGLFIAEDPLYDPEVRQTGFNRYKQLLALHAGRWLRINLITLLGALPLAAGIGVSLLSSSLLLLVPCCLAGGAVLGPFWACLTDSVLRALRDASGGWWANWRAAWKNNWRDSLLPGAVMGLFCGLYAFMCHLFWWAQAAPSLGTVCLFLFSVLLFVVILTLYWPQLVLFRQKNLVRLRNCLLFCIRHFARVMGVGLLQMAYLAVMILFAPWTLLLLPVLGVWYIQFLAQFLLYDQLDEAFAIEESIKQARAAGKGGSPAPGGEG